MASLSFTFDENFAFNIARLSIPSKLLGIIELPNLSGLVDFKLFDFKALDEFILESVVLLLISFLDKPLFLLF